MKPKAKNVARIFAFICIFGLVLTLCSGSLWAEMRKGAVTISPMVGGYLFEGNQDFANGFYGSLGLGYNFTRYLGVELSGKYVDFDSDAGVDGEILAAQLDLLLHVLPKWQFSPYLVAGVGAMNTGIGGTDAGDFFANYGLGVNIFLTSWLALRGDVRHIIDFTKDAHINHYNNWTYSAGLNFVLGGESAVPKPPPPMDSDGDGIYDSQDSCPGTPQGANVGSDGCPLDSDGDGVYDYRDKCPDTPPDVKVDGLGCPLDSDVDGVYDYLDNCPDTAKGANIDAQGCPIDSDGDGVFDYLDNCPDTSAGKRVDAVGCPFEEVSVVQQAMAPAVVDADGDGVNDDVDKCLNTPPGVKVNALGCWVVKVHFDFNRWNIKPGDYRELNDFVATLNRYRDLDITIEGHTDNFGSATYNQILSRKRAKAVLDYLVKHGIGRSRLSAIGYGASRPLVPNTSRANRAINRRVQLSQ
jgi:OmpA-OmpF porin, OOP family